jgi:hypothetical protein
LVKYWLIEIIHITIKQVGATQFIYFLCVYKTAVILGTKTIAVIKNHLIFMRIQDLKRLDRLVIRMRKKTSLQLNAVYSGKKSKLRSLGLSADLEKFYVSIKPISKRYRTSKTHTKDFPIH